MFATVRRPMLAALLSLIVVSSDSSIPCPSTNNCHCQHYLAGTIELSCYDASQQNTFQLKVEPGNTVKFQCITSTWMEKSQLPMLHVGPTPSVMFRFCPPLNVPLYQILQSIGTSAIEDLVYEYSNLSYPLQSSFLSGLDNLTSLILHSNMITTLPVDFFQNMNVLRDLDMKDNTLHLPLHVFDPLSNLRTLELGGNRMTSLEVGIFRNLSQLDRLNLWGNNLQNLTQDVFTGLSSLQFLDLSSNKLTSIPADLFANMPQLREIYLPQNNFTSLPHGLFTFTKNLVKIRLYDNRQRLRHVPPGLLANLTNLREVDLRTCGITELPEDIFWGSTAIEIISLNGNLLTSLPANVFRDTVQIKTLTLDNNRLQVLPDGVFSRLDNLRDLELNHNWLTNISRDVMRGLNQLEYLNLEHNRLQHIAVEAFQQMTGLRQLRLSHNRLSLRGTQTYVGEVQSVLSACVNLKELHVSNNTVSTIFSDWSLTFLHLRQLDLSHNLISSIVPQDIHFLSNEVTVNLTHNNISIIDLQNLELLAKDQNHSQHLPKRKILLDKNPLMCDCKVYYLLRYLELKLEPEARNMFELIPGDLSCAGPPEVRGVSVKQLSSLTLTCSLPQLGECPQPCTCYERPADSSLIIDCTDLNLAQSPATLPDPVELNTTVLSPKTIKLNQTELWLKRNSIVTLPPTSAPGYDKVTRLYLSHNNISTLESQQLPPYLQVLELDNNNLSGLKPSTLQALSNRPSLQRLTLHNNPWHCDCSARGMLNFLQEHFTQVAYLSNITCGDVSGRSLSNLTYSELCPESKTTAVAVGIAVALLGIMAGILVALYYYFQCEIKVWLYARGLCLWFVTEEELDKDKQYDAFISYSHHDEEFVVNKLVPELEGGAVRFKLCLHYRDWIAGEWIPNQIARSVEDSRRTLVVLSPNFLESVWGRVEFRTAHSQALSEGRARVIVLLYGEIGPLDQLDPELRAYLSMNTYVKWGDPWFWDKLRYALPHPQKVSRSGKERKTCWIAKDDKLELIYTISSPATPSPDVVTNPLETATSVPNGHVQTDGKHMNGYIK